MTHQSSNSRPPRVFLCHAKIDADLACAVYEQLLDGGADPWLDKKQLILGDDWEYEIKRAIAAADVVVVFLRPGFEGIGIRQKEVRWALDALQQRPQGVGFIIPFVVEPCDLPYWCMPLHAGGNLSQASDMSDLFRAISKHTGILLKLRPLNPGDSLRRELGLHVAALEEALAPVRGLIGNLRLDSLDISCWEPFRQDSMAYSLREEWQTEYYPCDGRGYLSRRDNGIGMEEYRPQLVLELDGRLFDAVLGPYAGSPDNHLATDGRLYALRWLPRLLDLFEPRLNTLAKSGFSIAANKAMNGLRNVRSRLEEQPLLQLATKESENLESKELPSSEADPD